MPSPLLSGSLAVLAGVGVVLTGFAVLVFRQWDAPERIPLVAYLCVLGVGTVVLAGAGTAYTGTVFSPTPSGGSDGMLAWTLAFSWLATAATFPWGVFVLRYTGRGEAVLSSRWRTTAVGAIVGTSMFWPIVDQLLVRRLSPESGLGDVLGLSVKLLVASFTVGWLVFLGWSLVALLRTTRRYDYLGPTYSASLGLAPVVPLVTISLGFQFAAVIPAASVWFYALGNLVSGGLVVVAIYRYDILETSAAASNVGRETVFADLDDVVIVVDDDGQVVDLNPAAQRALAVDDATYFGTPLADLLGADIPTLERRSEIELRTADVRHRFDPQVSTLSDHQGEAIGHAVTLRDVTDRAIREQRLAVLNRVLRHNLRNNLSVAQGVADLLVDGERPPEHLARDLQSDVEELMALAEKAREVERRMESVRTGGDPVAVGPLVASVVADCREAYPEATFETDVPEGLSVRGDRDLLAYVVANLVENAAEHNDADSPWVAVNASEVDGQVTIAVADDGPGIPDHERGVIEAGAETPLEHGSGLGLWVANWGAMRLGGDLAFRDRSSGTVVELTLPRGA